MSANCRPVCRLWSWSDSSPTACRVGKAAVARLLTSLFYMGLVVAAIDASGQSVDGRRSPAELAKRITPRAVEQGNPGRGAVLFAAPTSACLSCHRVGEHGGAVGPDLTMIGSKQSLEQIVDSVVSPARVVAEPYRAIKVLASDGRVIRGYRESQSADSIVLRDSASGQLVTVADDEIEAIGEVGSLMPEGLLATMSDQDCVDLIAFLAQLGTHDRLGQKAISSLLGHSHGHHPETFAMPRPPLDPEAWPSWQAHVNRDRLFDFYGKQARHFREASPRPSLLAPFPGLDGGVDGHWGNQSEPTWADGRWNDTDLGSLLSGVFHGDQLRVDRAVCLHLGQGDDALSTCFDTDTLSYRLVWKGGFLKFSDVRHGFMHGLRQSGTTVDVPDSQLAAIDATSQHATQANRAEKKYHGFYRHGRRVIFAYRVGDTEYLDAASAPGGEFRRVVAPRDEHPDRDLLRGGAPQWPQSFATPGELGTTKAYTVDKVPLPHDNPWKSLIYCAGHDFLSDGSAIVSTMQGDVWRVSGLEGDLSGAKWRRIASGLHQPLGVVVHDDQIFVIGRDQLTRLHDHNDDGEVDYYESFSRALQTSPGGHDFTCGLARDSEGRFYTVSGKEGVMRITANGRSAEVLATGLRNGDGLGWLPEGIVTVPSSEGDWTPASMIAAIRPDGTVLNRFPSDVAEASRDRGKRGLPFFGRPGTGRTDPPDLPMLYLPRGLDNSSGGQVYVDSDRWGPLQGQLVHLSFGAGTSFLVLRDQQGDWIQGAAVPLTGEFASGAHRGKFNPVDGQLYVSGMAGWGAYTTDEGCFHRVRYTGNKKDPWPVGFHLHENGIHLRFSAPIDATVAGDMGQHFVQVWNYRYSGAYGSPEYSTRQLGLLGHDVLSIRSATIGENGKSLFLEVPDLQPVNQLHLLVQVNGRRSHDLFMTVHQLDAPYQITEDYVAPEKIVLPHPIFADLARPLVVRRNPHRKAIPDARPITIRAAKNLSFDTTELVVQPEEAIRLTFENPDAVPHNWALFPPGSLQQVGALSNRMIADPQAASKHYIPESSGVMAYTEVVAPHSQATIYFNAPKQPGRYPFLCTFPGHWMVMNGTLIVRP